MEISKLNVLFKKASKYFPGKFTYSKGLWGSWGQGINLTHFQIKMTALKTYLHKKHGRLLLC